MKRIDYVKLMCFNSAILQQVFQRANFDFSYHILDNVNNVSAL